MSEKLKVEAVPFANAINWSTKSLDGNDTSAYIQLKVENGNQANLSFLNQYSFMKAPLDLTNEISEDFKVAINAQFLSKLADPISKSSTEIELVIGEKNGVENLQIKTSNGNFNAPLLDSRMLIEPEVKTLGSVREAEFFDFLSRVSKLCDTSHSRPSVGAVDVKFTPGDNEAVLMGTDTYALAVVKTVFSSSSEFPEELSGESILIPQSRGSFISGDKKSLDDVEVILDEKSKKIGYRFLDGRVAMFAPTAAAPLPYQEIKNNVEGLITTSFVVNTSELKEAIATILNLAWNDSATHWTVTNDGITVKDIEGENRVVVPLESADGIPDDGFKISFTRDVISKAFHPIATKKTKISIGESIAVLEQVSEAGETLDNVFSFARAEDEQ